MSAERKEISKPAWTTAEEAKASGYCLKSDPPRYMYRCEMQPEEWTLMMLTNMDKDNAEFCGWMGEHGDPPNPYYIGRYLYASLAKTIEWINYRNLKDPKPYKIDADVLYRNRKYSRILCKILSERKRKSNYDIEYYDAALSCQHDTDLAQYPQIKRILEAHKKGKSKNTTTGSYKNLHKLNLAKDIIVENFSLTEWNDYYVPQQKPGKLVLSLEWVVTMMDFSMSKTAATKDESKDDSVQDPKCETFKNASYGNGIKELPKYIYESIEFENANSKEKPMIAQFCELRNKYVCVFLNSTHKKLILAQCVVHDFGLCCFIG